MSAAADPTTSVETELVAAEPDPSEVPARRHDRPLCPCCAVWLFDGVPVQGSEGSDIPP